MDAKDSVPKEDVDFTTQIQNCKRDLLCDNICGAVQSMATICENMSKVHGELGLPMAEAYYVYGSALLEMARIETNVLGNALEGMPEVEEESADEDVPAVGENIPAGTKEEETKDNGIEPAEENALTADGKEELSEKILDAMCEDRGPNEAVEKPSEDVVPGNAKASEISDEVAGAEETGAVSKEAAEEETGSGAEGAETGESDDEEAADENEENVSAEGDEEADADDVSNLQLAWETLDMARLIYERRFAELEAQPEIDSAKSDLSQTLLKWADCVYKLSEVGMELGRWDQSAEDAQQALMLRKRALTHHSASEDKSAFVQQVSNNRLLSESHYHLAIVLSGKGDFETAVREIEHCSLLLSDSLSDIRRYLISHEDMAQEEKTAIEKHAQEIESILPDITSRCQELQSEKVDLDATRKELKDAMCSIILQNQPQAKAAPADDISHLVRKKRITLTSEPEKINGASEAVNGNHASNGVNGGPYSPPAKKMKTDENGDRPKEIVAASGDAQIMEKD